MRSRIPSLVSFAAIVALGHASTPCAGAQAAGAGAAGATPRLSGATINGVVRDSLSHSPLAGATVQLVAADTSTRFSTTGVADSEGRYALSDVPDGRFLVGFLHPLLDSLGVEAPLHEVRVDSHRSVRLDLATPSPDRLRAAICGAKAAGDSSAVLVGVVRDARSGAPMPGVSVRGDWMDVSFTKTGLVRRTPHLVANTGENGWFALCNVPRAGTMQLLASRGADSTDVVEVQIPDDGFLRRELYLGPAATIVSRDSTRHDAAVTAHDSTTRSESALSARRIRTGDGRVSGTVVTIVGAKPLPGARVSIANGPQVLTNERGEFSLTNAPVGTRVLDVRAVGYYPEHRQVDVVASTAPVRVALSTFKAVLDTVKVSATRYDRDLSGFVDRSRGGGVGRFLTARDITRRGAIVASDIFKNVPGLTVAGHGLERELTMRGSFGSCTPEIYLNGQFMPRMEAEDIDSFVTPERITAIEIYTDGHAPPQFSQALGGCGSIVIWHK